MVVLAVRVRAGRKKPWTKVPVSAKDGGDADTTAPDTWTSYGDALAYYLTHKDVDGIGYVFTDGVVGVDLDGCSDAGDRRVAAVGREGGGRLKGYTELTPSSRPAHHRDRPSCRRPGAPDPVEAYETGRFFTMTGWVVGNPPPTSRRGARRAG